MESVAIEVYGLLEGPDQRALRRAVAHAFDPISGSPSASDGVSVEFLDNVPGEQLLGENVGRPFIVRVCVLSEATASWQSFRSYLGLINHSPHAPVVFVELAKEPAPRSHAGGVTWAVHEPGDWAQVAETIRRAVETSWWRLVNTAEHDRKLLEIYEDYAHRLDTAEWRRPEVRILPHVRKLLLRLYRELFGLEAAFFRDYIPESRELRKKELDQDEGCPPADCDIISVIPVEGYPSFQIFNSTNVDARGDVCEGKQEEIKPIGRKRDRQEIEAAILQRSWTEAEKRYLRWIRSEIIIPVVVRNRVRGAIVGISDREDALPTDLNIVMRRFTNAAQLWYELGELHDAQFTAIRKLDDCLKAWQLLQRVEEGPGLYAGLAAILTAGCGLGWNRVLIFRNRHDADHVAELVYAVGWQGEPDHGGRQGVIDESESDLLELVKKRINHPVPRGSAWEPLDSLYATHVRNPPRAFSFAHPKSPLRAIANQEPSQRKSHLIVDRDNPPLLPLDGENPKGLFIARDIYVFPLYSREPERTDLLGFIVLDNYYKPSPLEDSLLALTLAFVELVHDLIDARQRYRLFEGMLLGLPFIRHGFKVQTEWSKLNPLVGELLDALETDRAPTPVDPGLVSSGRELLAQMDKPVQNLAAALDLIESWRSPYRMITQVKDLRAYLVDLADLWAKEATLDLKIDLGPGVELPCDELVFKNTMKCLLENAASVSPRVDGRFHAWLTAKRLGPVYPFAEMIKITLRDSGPGIRPEKVPYIFMDGFTDRRDLAEPESLMGGRPKHQGLGLGMARAYLLRARGELRLEDPGYPGRGALFALYFGLKPRPT
jgi:signal transduction histidine kinase